jgi:hypothetical protein
LDLIAIEDAGVCQAKRSLLKKAGNIGATTAHAVHRDGSSEVISNGKLLP